MTDYSSYVGSELELFRHAKNWKHYVASLLARYLGPEVLEVGAGIGSTTEVLCKDYHHQWVCLEPDPSLTARIKELIEGGQLPGSCIASIGTLSDLNPWAEFDSVLYIDVLEHIECDRQELELAANHLKDNGFLIILAPAHQGLFTPFDQAIGHYCRYSKKTLSAVIPDNLECVKLLYLDSIGLLASLANRFLLQSKMPTKAQISLWDRGMVPLSRLIDPVIGYSLGKSVLGIWRKKA